MPRQTSEFIGRQYPAIGEGGETHQVAGGGVETLTTAQGIPVADDQNSLKIGPRGPTLLEDFHFREKIFHFDHERIPERVVHARGFGAHGYFRDYEVARRHHPRRHLPARRREDRGLRALLDRRRQQGLGRPRPRRARLRGEALHQGGQLGPRRQQHPGLLHPGRDQVPRPDPRRQAGARPRLPAGADRARQFLGLHLADARKRCTWCMWIMSDRTIPRSFRFMEGFGVHTFRLVNAEGKSTFVKFHWKPKQGLQSVVWNEAVKINGADPDFHRRDLWDAIQMRRLPGVGARACSCSTRPSPTTSTFDVLDATKIIPEEEVPVRRSSAGWCSTAASTISSPRPSRSRSSTGNIVAGHRLHQRPAAAGPQLLLSRHPAEAARQPQLHPPAGQRAALPVPPLPAGRPHGASATRRGGRTTSRTPGAPRAARARTRSAASAASPPRTPGTKRPRPRRDLRRPLQPGAAVLPQPDAGRAGPHRRRLGLRAQQGRDAGDPRADGRRTC